ncbi:NAD(P)H-flavin reductase [Alteromonas oceanisediminis]|uniref:NAD(P)H-flavin reductase n=1 Tax=Alteromonas oceanisediminis TaxID=2836180 RepID=UPI001BD981A6|nr:NAD(P)H-flavin reductase [Alteromonas oceanisediminis]MBT0587751.1 NAD(P)H-flavin reductase [Alteromonas oceanisediminis]
MSHTARSLINCTIEQIKPLTPVVYEITLAPDEPVDFVAGQYVKVVMSDTDARPFSIANAPQRYNGAKPGNHLFLQIGAQPDNPYAWEVLEKLRAQDSVQLDGPHGNAAYQPSLRPLLLIAGGTGFSYVYAILQQALLQDPDRQIELFWGVRHIDDFYCLDDLNALSEQYSGFRFSPVLENATTEWQGLTGWVHTAVMTEISDLSGFDVYVAGRFEMAKVVRDDFGARGLPASQLFGDAYDYL